MLTTEFNINEIVHLNGSEPVRIKRESREEHGDWHTIVESVKTGVVKSVLTSLLSDRFADVPLEPGMDVKLRTKRKSQEGDLFSGLIPLLNQPAFTDYGVVESTQERDDVHLVTVRMERNERYGRGLFTASIGDEGDEYITVLRDQLEVVHEPPASDDDSDNDDSDS